MDDTTVFIVGQLISLACIAGIAWNRLGSVEKSITAIRETMTTGFKDVKQRLDTQNGRIGNLEKWRAEQSGYRRGFEDAQEDEE